MTFNTNSPTNKEERNLNILIARFQKSQSNVAKSRAVGYAKANWEALGDDFCKACYWVFGRITFVKEGMARPASANLERVERLIMVRQEENAWDIFDV